ncbi:hypothetical protein MCOR02_011763 [Pyricularia oryzae]|nr:hypothetical protein MCOR02_011763 [Pyricularia oryzae]KAI6440133.1 hypothetical protein MCOR22_007428 [Pyricularia oryzae]KAI6445525.1 hypothetical protein MCOR17_010964 [Pyricularia oryzae]KAI6485318.1 hypothetical protein MCOR13_009734 [Pyricularia oryzae]KAI6550663.1 hypothetical protein MCOR04_011213 [Pyricularia oryzae]
MSSDTDVCKYCLRYGEMVYYWLDTGAAKTTVQHNQQKSGIVYSITGGASGIGRATAHLLARHGAAAIWIADKQTSVFDQVRKEIKEINQDTEVYLEDVDVGDNAQVQDWVQRIIKTSGALHGSANAAGIPQKAYTGGSRPAILIESDQEWERILRVNLDGVKYCTRAQVEAMLSMDKGSHPAIVNVTSVVAFTHNAGTYAYQVSKAACEHFTKALANDVGKYGIRVNSVLPGSTLTPMTKVFFGDIPEGKFEETMEAYGLPPTPLQPEDVARVIVWLLSENSLDVNGVGLPVGGSEP